MSRHEYTPRPWPYHMSLAVGWDPPLTTFFAQVLDYSKDEDENRVLVWIGGLPPHYQDIDEVIEIVNRALAGRLPPVKLPVKLRAKLIAEMKRDQNGQVSG